MERERERERKKHQRRAHKKYIPPTGNDSQKIFSSNCFCSLDRDSLPRIIESSNHRTTESLRLEKTSQITKSNHHPNTTMPAEPCPQVPHLRTFEYLQGWGLHHCPGQPCPMPDRSFSQDIFPNIQPKPPLTQPEATEAF